MFVTLSVEEKFNYSMSCDDIQSLQTKALHLLLFKETSKEFKLLIIYLSAYYLRF